METNHKYTTDGKKVVVIGALNSQEKIVQEIFVIDGCEIPQGEHFVVKSLLDAPAISWKEKSLKELEEKYEKESRHWQSEIDKVRKYNREQVDILQAKTAYIRKAIDHIAVDVFDSLVGFLSGAYKYYVVEGYGVPEIEEICKEEKLPEYGRGKLRLLSLFGDDDGTMKWAIHRYSDGSGSDKKYVWPFVELEDAEKKRNELIEARLSEGNYHELFVLAAKKYGIALDPDKLKAFKENEIEQQQKNMESYKAHSQKCKDRIREIESL